MFRQEVDRYSIKMRVSAHAHQGPVAEIDRSGKFPLRPIPELRPNQIPKHLPVSEASVKAGAPASCRCFGKKSRSFGKKSRSFGFLAEAPALPILPILENFAEAASADASAD